MMIYLRQEKYTQN